MKNSFSKNALILVVGFVAAAIFAVGFMGCGSADPSPEWSPTYISLSEFNAKFSAGAQEGDAICWQRVERNEDYWSIVKDEKVREPGGGYGLYTGFYGYGGKETPTTEYTYENGKIKKTSAFEEGKWYEVDYFHDGYGRLSKYCKAESADALDAEGSNVVSPVLLSVGSTGLTDVSETYTVVIVNQVN